MGGDETTHKIIVKVLSMNGSEILFRISESAQLWKLMAVYCDRHGLRNSKDVGFLFNGCALRHYHTPQQVNLKDGDVIHAMLHQTGS